MVKSIVKPVFSVIMSFVIVIFFVGIVYHDSQVKKVDDAPVLTEPQVAPSDQPMVGPTRAVVTPDSNSGKEDELWDTFMDTNSLFIPSLEIYAEINNSDGNGSTTGNKSMYLPQSNDVTQWVEGGTVTSENDLVLIAGQVKWDKKDAALRDLEEAELGSVAFVSDEEGSRQEFQLESIAPYRYQKTTIPLRDIDTQNKKLVVVATGGEIQKTKLGWIFEDSVVSTWKSVGDVQEKKLP